MSCEQFEILFIATLSKHAPLKKMYVRAKNPLIMTNTNYTSRDAYNRQRNLYLLFQMLRNIFMSSWPKS